MEGLKGRTLGNVSRSRDFAYADAADRVRFQASFAEKMLNALMVANGGAIVGLFTFIGNLAGKKDAPIHVNAAPLWIAFACFVIGLALTLGAHILAFLSQQMFYFQAMDEVERYDRTLSMNELQTDRTSERANNARGNRYYATGLALAAAGIIFFVCRSGCALFGLLP
ncbi:MAG: hypothetical protein DI606_04320 [Sphingobium sp.]|uniref:hypothetical protein n=1 Tax=Sphingobium sp. TaxID=1912891 RepID=UPI000DB589DD|nr:hypothetical protein [Sphingobium sp.]PZU13798.1 MAG: hypothetical protein DI606_04320 [Sphingobium sp.]